MPKLIGPDPNQVPTNADLGSLAYQDADSVNLGQLLIDALALDTSTPALRVKGYGGGTLLQLEDARAVTNLWGKMAVDADTNLILGGTAVHTIPTAAGATTSPHLQVMGHGDTYTTAAISSFSYSTNAYGPTLAFTRSQGSLATHGQVGNGRYAMTIAAAASDGTAYRQIGQILSVVETATGTDDVSGYLSFWTRPNGAAAALMERLRINSAGNVGIGTTSLTNTAFRVTSLITGSTTAYSSYNSSTVQSDVTSRAVGYGNQFNTAAAAFTVANYAHFYATGGTLGAGSANTTQAGFEVSSLMTQGVNNYGFYGNLASAANVYNLYMAGTASNYLNGKLFIGSTTDDGLGSKLQVNGPISIPVASGSIEMGLPGTASTPFIDFHSSANSNDYDARIIASGGAAAAGAGALTFNCGGGAVFNGQVIGAAVSGGWANDTVGSIKVRNNSGTGDGSLAVLNFEATGAYWAKLALRADGYFGLGGGGSGWRWYMNIGSGDMTAAGNVTAYSDLRLKKNIQTISEALARVRELRGVVFDRIDVAEGAPKRQTGVIAQEVRKVLPEAVIENPDGMLAVAYGNLAGLLIEAIKELDTRVQALEQQRI